MHVLSILLFSVSSNLDNLTVGVGYGIGKMKITYLSNLIISLISALGTFMSMYLGVIISKFLNEKTTNLIGSGILIIIGIFFCYSFFKSINKQEVNNVENKSLDIKGAISLGFALTINNFGVGFGASIAGLNAVLTSLITFFISVVFLESGYLLGDDFLGKIFGKYSELISGLIIIFIGFYEIFL